MMQTQTVAKSQATKIVMLLVLPMTTAAIVIHRISVTGAEVPMELVMQREAFMDVSVATLARHQMTTVQTEAAEVMTTMVMEETLAAEITRMIAAARNLRRTHALHMIAATLAIHRIYVTGAEGPMELVMQREAFMDVSVASLAQ